jgi:hypothetical protein
MHYIGYDVQRLVRAVPYMSFLRSGQALWLLRRQVRTLETCREFVPLYGSVRCAPLDFLYVYLQCVAAFDDLLLLDLLNEHFPQWRPILIASWLVALAPRAQYHDELVKKRHYAQHSDRGNFQWTVDLALGAITGEPPPELAEHHALLAQIRTVLAPLPKPVVRLRRIPPGGEPEEADIMLIQDRYRTLGVEAAHATIAGSPLRAITPGLADWKNACVLDSGDGRRLGPNREIWYWGSHL